MTTMIAQLAMHRMEHQLLRAHNRLTDLQLESISDEAAERIAARIENLRDILDPDRNDA